VVRHFIQSVDFTTANTRQRDLTTLEDSVNNFLEEPNIRPVKLESETFVEAGTRYIKVMVDYNIKND